MEKFITEKQKVIDEIEDSKKLEELVGFVKYSIVSLNIICYSECFPTEQYIEIFNKTMSNKLIISICFLLV